MNILVMGATGSGKTTTARAIACRIDAPWFELDALYWGPNWIKRDAFEQEVSDILQRHDAWVIDGNYRSVREMVAANADLIVWLDYSLPLILWRLAWRTAIRSIRRTHLWNGNRESARRLLQERFEIFRWSIHERRKLRTDVPALGHSIGPDKLVRVRGRTDLADMMSRLSA